jgi:hypothetical protein
MSPTDILALATGWTLVSIALGMAIARCIPPSANDPKIRFTHGEVQ